MTKIIEHSQKSYLGSYVKLYHLDLSKFNQGHFYMVEGPEGGGTAHQVVFDEITYSPYDLVAEGFDVTSDGSLPRPRFSISNVGGVFTSLVIENNNLKGATLTRIKTFDRFLDDGDDPDPDATFGSDVYFLDKKIRDDEERIEWELASAMDRTGSTIPGRTMVRGFCDHVTRSWDPVAGDYDYSKATCPWDGDPFDRNGDSVASGADEVFSKKLDSCCKARFGTAELPFRGFPGVARVRKR